MSATTCQKDAEPSVLSLAQLLEQQPPTAPPCLIEPGPLPPAGNLFVGGEPKLGKSLLVANLALSLAAGSDRTGFPIPAPRRVLVCQFELPVPQFVGRLATMDPPASSRISRRGAGPAIPDCRERLGLGRRRAPTCRCGNRSSGAGRDRQSGLALVRVADSFGTPATGLLVGRDQTRLCERLPRNEGTGLPDLEFRL